MANTPRCVVTVWELRARFNDGQYWAKAQAGELAIVVLRDGHPSSDSSGEPHCTRSQIVDYYDANHVRVARSHQYVREDGTIGGSGKPDPKDVLEGGVRYTVQQSRKRRELIGGQ